MFEKIVIRKASESGNDIDVGLLAETLLFYQNVQLVLDGATLGALTRAIGLPTLLSLVDEGFLSATFLRDQLAVVTNTYTSGLSYHDIGFIGLVGHQDDKHEYDDEEFVRKVVKNTTGSDLNSATVKHFLDKVPIRKLGELNGRGEALAADARADVSDPVLLLESAKRALKVMVPEYDIPNNTIFSALQTKKGFLVSSNLDFRTINEIYHKRVPIAHSSITKEYLLAQIADTRADLAVSSEFMGELLTDPISSELIKVKFGHILQQRTRSSGQIAGFQDMTLEDGKAIREAINTGKRSFAEFLPLLEQSQKFKTWISKSDPEAGLLREFYRASTADSWLDKLPTRVVRFVIFSILGAAADLAIAPGSGVAVGAADTFLVDRLARGWRPHQFVNSTLKDFV